MSRFTVSPRARGQLRDIYIFGIARFGMDQAERYRSGLEDCFAILARHPRAGRLSPSVRKGVRRHEHASHVILYRETSDGIVILAVLHPRQLRGLKL
ncbi:MAG: type II toxin-antitoxin system RelE/ParE family toxin [Mesorhizobium sp.]|nr:type II toxin-antitoxin system RelE/ParE family toxin [Mesorhizobium sp.]